MYINAYIAKKWIITMLSTKYWWWVHKNYIKRLKKYFPNYKIIANESLLTLKTNRLGGSEKTPYSVDPLREIYEWKYLMQSIFIGDEP